MRRVSELSQAVREFGNMQEAVATLADMLQRTLVITDYLDGQLNRPRASDVKVEVLNDQSHDDEAEEVDELDSSSDSEVGVVMHASYRSERGCLLASGTPTPQGSPSRQGSPRRNSPSTHFLDLDRAFRTRSYSPAPPGYVHIDDTTITSITSTSDADDEADEVGEGNEESQESQESEESFADVLFDSVESGPSPVSSPYSPGMSRFPYEHGGSLPTIPEVSEEGSPIQSRYWAPRQCSLSSVYSN